ncbi:hypothetical protein V8F33_005526 [Rhypophila sp. PSN 637]
MVFSLIPLKALKCRFLGAVFIVTCYLSYLPALEGVDVVVGYMCACRIPAMYNAIANHAAQRPVAGQMRVDITTPN